MEHDGFSKTIRKIVSRVKRTGLALMMASLQFPHPRSPCSGLREGVLSCPAHLLTGGSWSSLNSQDPNSPGGGFGSPEGAPWGRSLPPRPPSLLSLSASSLSKRSLSLLSSSVSGGMSAIVLILGRRGEALLRGLGAQRRVS